MITPDRLQEAIQRMFDAQLDRLKYMLVWEFQVDNVDPGPPVMCQLVSIDPRMPNCDVMLRPGADGAYCTPAEGSTVLVGFAGGDPSKPYIFATDYNSPTSVTVAGGGAAVGRVGDEVTITQAELTTAGAVAGSNPVTISSPLKCKITSGSPKVSSG